VSVAANANESARIKNLYITGGDVAIGETVTDKAAGAAILAMSGGTVSNKSACSIVVRGGTLTHSKGAVSSGMAFDGVLVFSASETATSLLAQDAGVIDFDQSMRAKTVTTLIVNRGGTVNNNLATCTTAVTINHTASSGGVIQVS
jgi:hypothetical protein